MIDVGTRKDGAVIKLLEKKKIGDSVEMIDIQDLVTELQNMPPALTQVAAYLRQMGGRCWVQKYIGRLWKSDKSRTTILDEDAGTFGVTEKLRTPFF